MIIAVDFDGTLCKDEYPRIGKPNTFLMNQIRLWKMAGNKVILWTCREGDSLQEAIDWCAGYDIYFDAVNDNLPENIAEFGNNCRKVYADMYIDDKNHPFGFGDGEIP